jgi:hypothetical protein
MIILKLVFYSKRLLQDKREGTVFEKYKIHKIEGRNEKRQTDYKRNRVTVGGT